MIDGYGDTTFGVRESGSLARLLRFCCR
jgi:hypothetical protein